MAGCHSFPRFTHEGVTYLCFNPPPPTSLLTQNLPQMPEQPAPPAINHRDPNVLVWVAAQKIGLETLHNDPAWGRDIPNNATNGIGQNEVVREMLNRVLDAIASLAVSKPKLQVVAVALNIGNRWSGENPKLTMAENKELLPGLAEHITGVWDLLRQMTLQDADIEVLSARLTKLVYIFSVEKNLKRYNKWMPRLDLFGSVLSDAKVEGQDAFQKDLASLRVMHTFLQELAVDRAAHATLPAACKGINDIIGVPVARMAQWVTLVEQTKLEHWNPHFEDIKTWDPTKPDDWLRHFDHSGKGEPQGSQTIRGRLSRVGRASPKYFTPTHPPTPYHSVDISH